MSLKGKAIGLAIASILATGSAQGADQRFQTQVDAEQARGDIVERAAGGTPETVRSGSGDWGNHSPLTNSVALNAIGVINEGASAALDELKTTQQELAQTQQALTSTQQMLQITASDLNTTISDLERLDNKSEQFNSDVMAELKDIRDSMSSGGGSQIGTETTSHVTYEYVTKQTCKRYDSYDLYCLEYSTTSVPHKHSYQCLRTYDKNTNSTISNDRQNQTSTQVSSMGNPKTWAC